MNDHTKAIKLEEKETVNISELEIGITLQVSGFLVSGILIAGSKYFEGFASDFSSGFKDEQDRQALKTAISKYGEIYKPTDDPLAGYAGRDSKPTKTLPSYIHLKNAKFFNTVGNQIPDNRGVWWRGRLSEVSGFILGSLRPEQAIGR
jgi:hypothetical protein